MYVIEKNPPLKCPRKGYGYCLYCCKKCFIGLYFQYYQLILQPFRTTLRTNYCKRADFSVFLIQDDAFTVFLSREREQVEQKGHNPGSVCQHPYETLEVQQHLFEIISVSSMERIVCSVTRNGSVLRGVVT